MESLTERGMGPPSRATALVTTSGFARFRQCVIPLEILSNVSRFVVCGILVRPADELLAGQPFQLCIVQDRDTLPRMFCKRTWSWGEDMNARGLPSLPRLVTAVAPRLSEA